MGPRHRGTARAREPAGASAIERRVPGSPLRSLSWLGSEVTRKGCSGSVQRRERETRPGEVAFKGLAGLGSVTGCV
ncbi:hypothetical protein E2562_008571 [Oryza meyeriana var. granulata]|uniref:Uncharacterized protein n=1 Tax=Oryza meyeriana var. granulata TaxID=110450 RepID=A0A6G1C6P7_9ORYZ|nr:hypothetical protein E2562_008571 [Oryza meyeriana var. granulata]